jgi:hypothetical protein
MHGLVGDYLRGTQALRSATLEIMARAANRKVDSLLQQIETLLPVDRVNLLARALAKTGSGADWSVLRRVRRRFKVRDPRALDRAADEGMRQVRSSRA